MAIEPKLDKIIAILEADFVLRRQESQAMRQGGLRAFAGGALGGLLGAYLGSPLATSRAIPAVGPKVAAGAAAATTTTQKTLKYIQSTPTPSPAPAAPQKTLKYIQSTPTPSPAPAAPVGPTSPVDPTAPQTPTIPMPAVGPTSPVDPTAPQTPTIPIPAVGPTSPVGPTAPQTPTIPMPQTQDPPSNPSATPAQRIAAVLQSQAALAAFNQPVLAASGFNPSAIPQMMKALKAGDVADLFNTVAQNLEAIPDSIVHFFNRLPDDLKEALSDKWAEATANIEESIIDDPRYGEGSPKHEAFSNMALKMGDLMFGGGPGGMHSMMFPPLWNALTPGMQQGLSNTAGSAIGAIGSVGSLMKGSLMSTAGLGIGALAPLIVSGIHQASQKNAGGGISEYDAARKQAQAGAMHKGGVLQEGSHLAHSFGLLFSENLSNIGRAFTTNMRVF